MVNICHRASFQKKICCSPSPNMISHMNSNLFVQSLQFCNGLGIIQLGTIYEPGQPQAFLLRSASSTENLLG